jgi:hypothetical protein
MDVALRATECDRRAPSGIEPARSRIPLRNASTTEALARRLFRACERGPRQQEVLKLVLAEAGQRKIHGGIAKIAELEPLELLVHTSLLRRAVIYDPIRAPSRASSQASSFGGVNGTAATLSLPEGGCGTRRRPCSSDR